MSLYCLIAIAGLCFTNPHVKAEVSSFPMGYVVVVTADHYKVNHAGTDTIVMHDFRKAPRACVDKKCIGYFKHCEPDGASLVCTYRLGIPGVVPDGEVTITADSEAALAAAEREVTRIGEGYPLPFALMTVRSNDSDLAICPPGTAHKDCAPP